MPSNAQLALLYLATSHIILYSTTTPYQHETHRLGTVALDRLHRLSHGYLGVQHQQRRAPRTGLYQSTEMLEAVQSSMRFDSNTDSYTTDGQLVAYMTATDAVEGQGWRARATLFLGLIAPRYMLFPFAPSVLKPYLRMFALAAADVPAVGPTAGSQDPHLGYKLTCTSPALQYGLGPQPVAICQVWQQDCVSSFLLRQSGTDGPAAAAAAGPTCPVGAKKQANVQPLVNMSQSEAMCPFKALPALPAAHVSDPESIGSSSSDWHISNSSSSNSSSTCKDTAAMDAAAALVRKPVANWTVFPNGVLLAGQVVAAKNVLGGQQLQQQEQQQPQKQSEGTVLPLLSGPASLRPPLGSWAYSMALADTWFIFPRGPYLKLVPAMIGWQQVLFGHAVLLHSWQDLLFIFQVIQKVHLQVLHTDPLRPASVTLYAISLVCLLLTSLACKEAVACLLAVGAVCLLYNSRAVLHWAGVLHLLPPVCADILLFMVLNAPMLYGTKKLFQFVWRLQSELLLHAQALLDASAAWLATILQGGSWQFAFQRFIQVREQQLQQRQAQRGGFERVQAQVYIQAPGDMIQAAEALRGLADELEDMGVRPFGMWHPTFERPQRRRVQVLGEQWPAPLDIPFDAEDVQNDLGIEVPRGFLCPITQDIMQLPALLISSSVAIPSTYDKDAIQRWLQDNRLDPKSRQPLAADAKLVPNQDLYRAIEDWVRFIAVKQVGKAAAAAAQQPGAHTSGAAGGAAGPPGAAEEGAVAAATAATGGPKPSSSAGAVCSSLLKAVKRAVRGRRGNRAYSPVEQQVCGRSRKRSLPLYPEDPGVSDAAVDAAAAAGGGNVHSTNSSGSKPDGLDDSSSDDGDAEVVSRLNSRAMRAGADTEQQLGVRQRESAGEQVGGGGGSRYNLRRRPGSTQSAQW